MADGVIKMEIESKTEPFDLSITPPSTPKRKKAGKGGSSPRKIASPRTPKGPTKAQLAKEASAKKKDGFARWTEYCVSHQWPKVRGFEHQRPVTVLHGTDGKPSAYAPLSC